MIVRKLLVACACALILAPAASAASGWTPTGAMAVGRSAAQATTLADGRVLVAGGFSGSAEVADSEVYDPATGTWTVVAPLHTGRHYATLTRLPDGRALIAGGYTAGGVTASAEIYDPATNAWSVTGAMAHPRNGHGATLLANGKVLVAGGQDGSHVGALAAELYDPASGTWGPAGVLAAGRENHLQERLADGRVLVAGGDDGVSPTAFRSASEIYDPIANAWSPTGAMATARSQGAGVVLRDGTVLVAGGINGGGWLSSAERFNPGTGTWSAAGMLAIGRNIKTGLLLPDGRALIVDVGGTQSVDLFDPVAGTFSDAAPMGTLRGQPTVTALPDGRVLVAGGSVGGTRTTSAEVWRGPTTRASADTDFGTVRAGAAAERDVTVANTGTLPLLVDGVAPGGADAGAFAVVGDGCVGHAVAAGATCTVRVRFTASGAPGPRTARLDLADNADGAAAPLLRARVEAAPAPPAPPAPGAPAPPTAPSVATPPTTPTPPPARACSSRRRFTVSKSLARSLRSGRATLNGKVVARLSPGRRTITVDLRGRRAGTYTLRVTIRTKAGRTVKVTRRYRTCAARSA